MIRSVQFQNAAGHTLRGMLTLPEGREKAACYVNLHGFSGTMGGFRSAHVHLARQLLAQDVACLRFDFFGNGESDGEFEEMTFTTLLQDTAAACAWVRSQPWFSGTLILSGQSLGGLVAANAAPAVQPQALVLMCPGAPMWFGCKERSDALREKGVEYGDIGGLKFSHDFNYDLARYNPFEDAKGYRGPVLLVRGAKDELVDEATIQRYIQGYTSPEYAVVEGGDHNFASIPARAACETAICGFVTRQV